jgi:hypothetical protein
LGSLSAVTFDPDLVAPGSVVSISYGLNPDMRRTVATIPGFHQP